MLRWAEFTNFRLKAELRTYISVERENDFALPVGA
jgi:hypothetical protein